MSSINDLLQEIKFGDNYYKFKLNEDVQEDFEEIEDLKIFRASSRLNKLSNRIDESEFGDFQTISQEIKKVASKFKLVEDKKVSDVELRESEAKLRHMEIKKSYDRINRLLKDRNLIKKLRENNILPVIGQALGTIQHGIKPVEENANLQESFYLKEDDVPFMVRRYIKNEIEALKKAE